jgi:cobalt-zinc-cadmium efflux system outer membrane protein
MLWLVLACGFSIAATPDSRPEPRPLGRDLATFQSDSVPPKKQFPAGDLSLRQALALALLHNPELAVFSWEIRAKEAEALQAGLLPNPELGIEMENFAGSGEFSGTDSAETTVTLSQLIELGGKRGKRRSAAALEADLAGWDFETKRLDVLTDTTKAFVSILAAQERLAQAEELNGLAERFSRTVSERVEAGKVSPVEKTRARIPLAAAWIAEGQARLALEAARKELVTLWGDDRAIFARAVGALEQVRPVPPLEHLTVLLDRSPDIARWETVGKQRDAQVALERTNAIPDPTLFVGGRNIQETDDHVFVAGFSIPLPLFDRNQGGIAAAQAARSKARHASQAAGNEAFARLAASYRDLSGAALEAMTLKERILPAAEQAFEASDLGYRAGKFGFLEVLDAQRTLFAVKGQYIEALAAYHQAKAEVERLIGAPLETDHARHQTGEKIR